MYNIELVSRSEDFWRYNLIVMCAGYNPAGEQLFVVSNEDTVAEVGADLGSAPSGYKLPRVMNLEVPAADNLRMLIYVIPHVLPPSRVIADYPPFDLEVVTTKHGEVVHSSVEQINQWGGASIQIDIQP